MVQTINVPGMGPVDFPSTMSDADISMAIKKNMPGGMPSAAPSMDPLMKDINTQISQNAAPPKSALQQIADFVIPHEGREGMQKLAGYGTMVALPEVKWLKTLLNPEDYKLLPELKGIWKTGADVLSNIGKVGTSVGIGSTMLPGVSGDDAARAGITGAGIATPLSIASVAARSMNPYARLIAGSVAGVAGGYGVNQILNGTPASGYAADALGMALGGYAGLRNSGLTDIALMNTAGKSTPEQLQAAVNAKTAGQQAGVHLNMGEALNNPSGQAALDSIGQTPESANMLNQKQAQRVPEEKAAIQRLLDQISPPNTMKKVESPLYTQVLSNQVPANQLAKVYSDPYLKKHIDQVLADPLYAKDLENVSPTSLKFLDLVKRRLDKIGYDPKTPDSEKALIQQKTRDLVGIMDEASPKLQENSPLDTHLRTNGLSYPKGTSVYEIARDISEKRQARDNIVRSINEADMNGKNFFDTWLEDDAKFKELRTHLRNREDPTATTPAQMKLDAMRNSFRYLVDPVTKRTIGTMGKESPEIPHSLSSGVAQMYRNLLFSRYNKALTDLIWKSDWDKEFERLDKLKSNEDKGIALGRLLSKIAATGSSATSDINTQGSDQYGGQPR